jgi:serine/threonine-protein kinase
LADFIDHLRAVVGAAYRVEREIGRGGMATVYLAEDFKHRRPVAIKVLDPTLAGVLGPDRFLREIETAARLQHPHVLPLLDSGSGGGILYYVMPYVAGESLRARMTAQRQLGIEEATRLTVEIARALDHAHRRGIVHRDIKPENVLLADGQALVSDFGIARALSASGGEKLTQTGMTLGSPSYMSPEQLAGAADLDGRSDLYSLGCVIYEMLAGQPPFSGPHETLAHQHLNVTPRPVREMRPTVTPALERIVARLLAKTPADRFGSAADLVTALTGEGVAVPPASLPANAASGGSTGATTVAVEAKRNPANPRPASRRSGRGWLVAAGLIVAAAAGFMIWRTQARPHGPTVAGRQWIWLAEFEGPASDPELASSVRDLVEAGLDPSQAFAAVPAEQIRIALRNAGRADSTRVTPVLARELAFRASIPVVIEGRVGKIGAAYNVVLKATRSSDGAVLETATASAASDRELIRSIAQATRQMRAGLGERSEVFLDAATWTEEPTASFEAFKLYLHARALINNNQSQQAIPVIRAALEADPEFASAWVGLGTALSNLFLHDSSNAAYRRALQYSDRLPRFRKADVEARLARTHEEALAIYQAALQLDPGPVDRARMLNNMGGTLNQMGRIEESLASYRESLALWPIEPPSLITNNIADNLIALGRWDEAAPYIDRSTGFRRTVLGVQLAIHRGFWAEAESLTRTLDKSPDAIGRVFNRLIMASMAARRGERVAAREMLARAQNEPTFDHPVWGVVLWMVRSLEIAPGGSPPPPVPASLAKLPEGHLAQALRLAQLGEPAAARAELQKILPGADPELRPTGQRMLAAWDAWHHHRWAEVVDTLRHHASVGLRSRPSFEETSRGQARWMVASAFVELGQRDSAAVYFEKLLSPPGNSQIQWSTVGFWEPYARCRLVEMYGTTGRLDDARREFDRVSEACTRPDPTIVAMIDRTRGILQSAGRMGASQRR